MSMTATWLRDWAVEWSTNRGELWISRICRCADGWTRTVTFDARPTGIEVERVAAVVDRMPAVEATIDVPIDDASSAGIRITHSEAQEPPIAEISALVVQLPRCSMRIEIARASNDKGAPEAPAPNELAQATAALTEARAKCDELREQLRQAHAICAGASHESALDAVRRTRALRNSLDAECAGFRSALASTQSTLDEALRVQGAIWDAVGGQRDGESLVDAVRRAMRLANNPGPRAEVSANAQYASFVTEADRAASADSCTASPAPDAHGDLLDAASEMAASIGPFARSFAWALSEGWELKRKNHKRILDGIPGGDAKRDYHIGRIAAFGACIRDICEATGVDMPSEEPVDGPHPFADAISSLSLDEIAALSAAGWVMRWTAPSMRWVTPGGAALDPATWRETLRREAARLTGKRFVVGAESEEAKMNHASEQVRDDSHIDSRRDLPPEDRASITVDGVTITAPRTMRLGDVWNALTSRLEFRVCLDGERQRAADETREAGRAEAKAEIARLRAENTKLRDDVQALVDGVRKALGARSNETMTGAATRVVIERDAAYQRGQESMQNQAGTWCDREAKKMQASGEHSRASTLWCSCQAIRSLPIAKTPTVSASEVTGEAIPGAVSAETAGARESVAREDVAANDLASRWKTAAASGRTQVQLETDPQWRGYYAGCADAYATCADELGAWRSDDAAEITRLRVEVERQRGIVEAYAAKVESYAAEIVSVGERLAKARYERGRSDDALKAIEDALLDAGAPRQGDESLVDAVRRALDNRDVRAAKVERKARVGDVVMYHGTKRSPPAIVLNLHADGAVDLREMDDLGYREGVPMGFAPGTWRFRD